MKNDHTNPGLTAGKLIALIALTLLMHEGHENSHTFAGRLLCGCWGSRDYYLWQLCEGCTQKPVSNFAIFTGPIFNYIMMWAGYHLLKNSSARARSTGIVLIFANQPVARFAAVLMGGGDEVAGFTWMTGNHPTAWMICLAAVSLLTIPPVMAAFKTLNEYRKRASQLVLLLVPILADYFFIWLINLLLAKNMGAGIAVAGTPFLVIAVTLLSVLVLILRRKDLYAWAKDTLASKPTQQNDTILQDKFRR